MIRVGIGGWTFAPWRGVFYPPGLAHAKELGFASRAVTAIEVNGTYYSGFKPATFAKWRDETPEGFLFTLKAARFCTNRKVLAEAGESVARFVEQGIAELGDKLGPILWQFMPTKTFDADDLGAFLDMLPAEVEGLPLRHALEVRHESFRDPAFIALARAKGAAVVFADSGKHPQIDARTADFAYARLQAAQEDVPTGYAAPDIARFADLARAWASGKDPTSTKPRAPAAADAARDVFVFMINGAKVRAPAAAGALLDHLGG